MASSIPLVILNFENSKLLQVRKAGLSISFGAVGHICTLTFYTDKTILQIKIKRYSLWMCLRILEFHS